METFSAAWASMSRMDMRVEAPTLEIVPDVGEGARTDLGSLPGGDVGVVGNVAVMEAERGARIQEEEDRDGTVVVGGDCRQSDNRTREFGEEGMLSGLKWLELSHDGSRKASVF